MSLAEGSVWIDPGYAICDNEGAMYILHQVPIISVNAQNCDEFSFCSLQSRSYDLRSDLTRQSVTGIIQVFVFFTIEIFFNCITFWRGEH